MRLALEFCLQDLLSLIDSWSTPSWKYTQIILYVGHIYILEVGKVDSGNGLILDDCSPDRPTVVGLTLLQME